jgi:tight adherence protein B
MTATAAVLLAAALLALPLPASAVCRLGTVLPRVGPAVRWPRWRPPVVWSAPAAGLLAGLTSGGAGLAVAPAVAVGLLVAFLARVVDRRLAGRREERELDAVVEAVSTLSAELRAGQQPGPALRTAAAVTHGAAAQALSAAAATALLGGSAPATLRAAGGCAEPAAGVLRWLAAGWQVSESAGAPLCAVLEQADQAARAGRARRRQLAALLAAPRATAALLAGLPAVGLALGAAMGASPVTVLLHAPAGQGALLTGVVLELAGMAWTGRIVRVAGAAP